MNEAFTALSNSDLQALLSALRTGRLGAPYTGLQVARVVPPALAAGVREALVELAAGGFSPGQIVTTLALIERDRAGRPTAALPIDLVTSGPDAPGVSNRDTAVVVRELFAHAQRSVLVVGYAVHQGQQVFEALAQRMAALPELEVKLFLNIARPDGDTTPAGILISQFRQRFRDRQWPAGYRLPEVYFDPRSLADDRSVRSSLHAKCVVVDGTQVFVSSANFTVAGQERNIEVGLRIESPAVARGITEHFRHLLNHGHLERAFE
jgi:phosphatidylserine/phosphatidylglycerophosphate/cardiolipin synthase-like enzyme